VERNGILGHFGEKKMHSVERTYIEKRGVNARRAKDGREGTHDACRRKKRVTRANRERGKVGKERRKRRGEDALMETDNKPSGEKKRKLRCARGGGDAAMKLRVWAFRRRRR